MTDKEIVENIKKIYTKYQCECGEDLYQSSLFKHEEQNEMLIQIAELIYNVEDF